MERYQIILAYDGSHFKGFQRQAKARSVQGVVEAALRKLGWQGKSILAAGRTDTGVHARGQVITADLEWKHDPQELLTALNSYLPNDVAACDVKKVSKSFHPRHDASWRKYLYRIYCMSLRDPLLEPYAWRIWPEVSLDVMQTISKVLLGTHDFGAFGTPPQTGGSTSRVVLDASWHQEAPFYVFEITAQAYLYHMVRRIVFMLVSIGQGKLAIEDLQRALDVGTGFLYLDQAGQPASRRLVHGLAPAQGLILAEVHYSPETYEPVEDN